MNAIEVLSILGVGIAVFVTTNIDDIVLVSALFADDRLRARDVVLGQLIAIVLLVAASAVCAVAALAVPETWIALLGVVPLGIGLWNLPSAFRAVGVDADGGEQERAAERRTHSRVLAVALVTVANGGDNLAVYIPLFAKQPRLIPIYAAEFLVMTVVFCGLGYLVVNNPLIGARVRRAGRFALPIVLIALGVYILRDAFQ